MEEGKWKEQTANSVKNKHSPDHKDCPVNKENEAKIEKEEAAQQRDRDGIVQGYSSKKWV